MADIRLNKILRQYNIGLDDLVEFLHNQGVEVEANPNSKVSEDFLPAISRQFGKDLEMKQASDKVDIKMTAILEKTAKKPARDAEEDDEPEQETVIKSNTFINTKKEAAQLVQAQEAKPAVAPKAAEPVKAAEPAKAVVPEREDERVKVAVPEKTAEPDDVKRSGPAKVVAREKAAEPVHTEPAPQKPVETSGPVVAARPVDETVPAEPAKPVETARSAEPASTSGAVRAAEPVKAENYVRPTEPAKAAESHKPAAEEKPVMNKQVSEPVKVENPAVHAAPAPEAKVQAGPAPVAPHAQTPHPAQPANKISSPSEPSLKVIGKIDMSQFERKPAKKHERINKGTQKVDVAKAGANIEKSQRRDHRPGQPGQPGQAAQPGAGRGPRKRDRFKPAMTEAEQDELQKEIQKQVKETYAKMNEGKKNNFGAKYRKEKREAAAQRTQDEAAEAAAEKKILKVTEYVTVNDLATLMGNMPVVKVIGACMSLGLMVSINQRLDAETIVLVAEEFGYKVDFVTAGISDEISSAEQVDKPEDLVPRPPIITVMGHVDHGKTSLLDYIRKSNIIAGEAGGITQHIGAYNVALPDGRRITFLDTPGHEAFTAMRARGAQLTDIAIIIVAADDAVMPQTIEAINHAQAANVPMVFAINKIDKPGANPDTIRRQLSEMNILVEDWGGKYQCQEISAKKIG